MKQAASAGGNPNQQPWASAPQPFGTAINGASIPLSSSALTAALDAQGSLRSPGSAATMASSLLPPSSSARSVGSSVANAALPSAASSPLPPLSAQHAGNGVAGPQLASSGQVPQTPAQQVLFSPADRYGLLGLLHIIKSADSDVNMLALGTDLTTLGLDLGAADNLYSNLITPWSDSKAAAALNIEPEFHLPSCYNVQPPPAQSKISNFSDETLFFIFYSQPRDVMQELAAHELYKHNWRYHKELRLWLTKEAGTEPTQKTATFERGSYIVFDPTLWERVRKEFVLEFSALESRRM
ncbi:transcriptional regulator [Microbotryomycetes sp. JL201]|nr:transcriptional regulator [Microbotryomycetes sp. JL201]